MAKSPINISVLLYYLQFYDKNEAPFSYNGFRYGFPLQYDGSRVRRDSNYVPPNLTQINKSQICKEIQAGRVAGPFTTPPLPNLIVSAICLVKKNSPG